MDPVAALVRLGGVSRWPRMARLDVGRSTLIDACRAGVVLRPARGVFCLPGRQDDEDSRALMARGQLSCAHAARAHGLELFVDQPAVHVRIPVDSTRTTVVRGVVVHRWGRIGDGELTPLLATLRDCAWCLPPPQAVAILDSALRSGRLTGSELLSATIGWPPRARRLLALTDGEAQSVLESAGRVELMLSAVGSIASQVHVADVGWVDLVVDGWLVVEFDGFSTHRASFREDRRRDAELTRRGFVVLRFTYPDVLHRANWLVQVVRDTLVRGRPPFAQLHDADDFAGPDRGTPRWKAS